MRHKSLCHAIHQIGINLIEFLTHRGDETKLAQPIDLLRLGRQRLELGAARFGQVADRLQPIVDQAVPLVLEGCRDAAAAVMASRPSARTQSLPTQERAASCSRLS